MDFLAGKNKGKGSRGSYWPQIGLEWAELGYIEEVNSTDDINYVNNASNLSNLLII